MVGTPRHIFTEPVVVVSGMGFDDFGELTYSGSVSVSGSGYLKFDTQYELTNAEINTFTLIEAFTDPAELSPQVADRMTVRATAYRIVGVRPVIDRDGFHALDISQLKKVEI